MTTHPKNKLKRLGAGFSSLSFQEKPAAENSKFFQASIGKHLNKQTNSKIKVGRQPQPHQDPPPASARGRLDEQISERVTTLKEGIKRTVKR